MKISGNKKKGHYTPDSRRNQPPPPDRYHRVQDAEQTAARGAVKRKNSYRAAKILIAILVIILAILVAIYIFLNLGLKPPPVKTVPKPVTSGGSDAAAAAPTGATEQPVRDKTKFTFVILGMDDGNGNTDTMMVATFDDANYTLNVVNIPRDTLVNVSWHTKKANTFYANGGG